MWKLRKEEARTEKEYAFFCHRTCEFFPCHAGIEPESFNCLFCYCPLYPLGETCGGAYVMLENGVKDCSGCALPHRRENYDKVTEQLSRIKACFPEKE